MGTPDSKFLTEIYRVYIIAPLMPKMHRTLPDKFDPWKLAQLQSQLTGELDLHAMQRLSSLLNTASGRVKVRIKAGIDEGDVRFLRGDLDTVVELICQRCLTPMALALKVAFRLGLVHTEAEALNLPNDYDPVYVPNEGLTTSELIEDELILALPFAPCHADQSQCEANGYTAPDKPSTTSKPNPFALLSTLLPNSDKE